MTDHKAIVEDCPMCAKGARVFKEGRNFEGRPLYHVACKRDRCQIRTKNELSANKAIKKWNARVIPENLIDKTQWVERLEGMKKHQYGYPWLDEDEEDTRDIIDKTIDTIIKELRDEV